MPCGRCPGGGGGNPVTPTCGANCLRAEQVTIPCSETTGPCTGSFSRDLTTDNTDNNGGCTAEGCEVIYQLQSHTTDLSNVVLTTAGLLTGDINSNAVSNTLATVRYRRFCSCNSLSATGKVFVCIFNNCANSNCEEDEQCNKCTGLCEPIIPNAILT